jgi:hypothetical protein
MLGIYSRVEMDMLKKELARRDFDVVCIGADAKESISGVRVYFVHKGAVDMRELDLRRIHRLVLSEFQFYSRGSII